MDNGLLICRCQEVTEAEIKAAIADGATTVDGVKRRTRAGMGLCQGKTCGRLVQQMITRGNVSSAMRMPMWIVYIVLPLASGIFTLRLIGQVVEDIKGLCGHGSDDNKEVA